MTSEKKAAPQDCVFGVLFFIEYQLDVQHLLVN